MFFCFVFLLSKFDLSQFAGLTTFGSTNYYFFILFKLVVLTLKHNSDILVTMSFEAPVKLVYVQN